MTPDYMTPEYIAAAKKRIAQHFGTRATPQKENDWLIDGHLYDLDNALSLAAHETGQSSSGYPMNFNAGAAYRRFRIR